MFLLSYITGVHFFSVVLEHFRSADFVRITWVFMCWSITSRQKIQKAPIYTRHKIWSGEFRTTWLENSHIPAARHWLQYPAMVNRPTVRGNCSDSLARSRQAWWSSWALWVWSFAWAWSFSDRLPSWSIIRPAFAYFYRPRLTAHAPNLSPPHQTDNM